MKLNTIELNGIKYIFCNKLMMIVTIDKNINIK